MAGDFTSRSEIGLIEQGGEVVRRYGVRFPDSRVRLVTSTFGEAKEFAEERGSGYTTVRQIIMYSGWAET